MTIGTRRLAAAARPYDHVEAVAWLGRLTAAGGTCIDVSHVGQGTLPQSFFNAAKAAGVVTAIIKAGGANGGLYKDPAHDTHVTEARTAGLNIGHYMFNGRAVSMAAFADAFVSYANPQTGDEMWTDIEAEGSMAAFTPAETLAVHAQVRTHSLPTPGVYLNEAEVEASDWSPVKADGSPLWEAAYISGTPNAGVWGGYVWWQYTDALSIGGVNVDGSIRGNQTPNYVGGATSGDEDMATIVTISDWANQTYLCVPGRYIMYITGEGQHLPAANALAAKTTTLASTYAQALLDEMGMGNHKAAELKALPSTGAKLIRCDALDPAGIALTDAQISAITAAIPAGVTVADVQTSIAAALASLDLNVSLTGAAKTAN